MFNVGSAALLLPARWAAAVAICAAAGLIGLIPGMPLLPFAALAGDLAASCCVGRATGFSGLTGAIGGVLTAGGSTIALAHGSAAGTADLTDGQFTDSSELRFSVSYEAA